MRASRPVKPPTFERLEKAALAYVERYASSAETLRRVLMRRVERAARAGVADRAEGGQLVDRIVARCVDQGLVDDRRYAEAKAASLLRQGRPRAAIARRLAAQGVGREHVATAVEALAGEGPEPDLVAALAFARRRRLGPYRAAEERALRRDKDLAAFARAGFTFELARRVLGAESPEALAADIAAAASGRTPR